MKKILVTGGTVFVSRYIAEYYVSQGHDVYVLNRNTKEQPYGTTLIEADRHNLGKILQKHHFDTVIDTAYSSNDVNCLLDALGEYKNYILISSSAVYPEYASLPFRENTSLAENKYWGKYGTDKIEAEKSLLSRNPEAYVIRPPYLYGQMNNVYREAFVFDCALADRPFYLPQNGHMKLQFFHVHDLCRFIDAILNITPKQHIFNAGNKDLISVREWVNLCYNVAGRKAKFISVDEKIEQRNYFSFYNYEYYLDVSSQYELLGNVKALENGLKESFDWYINNKEKVNRKPYIEFIDNNLKRGKYGKQ